MITYEQDTDPIGRLLSKRWGRVVWVFGVIAIVALLWGTGTWLASLALGTVFFSLASIFLGLIFGCAEVVVLVILFCLIAWIWEG